MQYDFIAKIVCYVCALMRITYNALRIRHLRRKSRFSAETAFVRVALRQYGIASVALSAVYLERVIGSEETASIGALNVNERKFQQCILAPSAENSRSRGRELFILSNFINAFCLVDCT